MKKWLVGFLLLLLVMLTGFGAGLIFHSTTVFSGVKIDGYDLGGMSRPEMENWLRDKEAGTGKNSLTFYYQNIKFNLDAKDIGYAIDVEATADSIWRYGREGPIWTRLKSIFQARRDGHEVPVSVHYDQERVKKILEQWADKINSPAKNASLSIDTGKIIPGQMGRNVDIEQNKEQMLRAMREGNKQIPIIVQEVTPHISAEEIEKSGVKHLLGIYTTYFNNNDLNRTANIRLAAEKINGTLLQPGEVFSYNEIVGPRDTQHGFKEALEIVDGELVPGTGGGVCQVSSTLYNAALYAGLQIIERTNHSKPLSYVPLARDATVVYGYLDFRFVNNTTFPILILAEVSGGQLKTGIFGREISDQKVQIYVVGEREIPPGTTKKDDPALPVGETKVEKPGSPGYEATAIRVWTVNGKEIRREFLSTDVYSPTNTIVRVGTKPAPVKLPPAATTLAPAADNKKTAMRGNEPVRGKKEDNGQGRD